jgi:hypothetical protein
MTYRIPAGASRRISRREGVEWAPTLGREWAHCQGSGQEAAGALFLAVGRGAQALLLAEVAADVVPVGVNVRRAFRRGQVRTRMRWRSTIHN